MTDIASAIKALKDDAEFVVSGEPSNEAEYKANVKYVTGADSNGTAIFGISYLHGVKYQQRKLSYKLNTTTMSIKRKRAAEYPAIVDQLDEIYHNGIDGWKTKIKAVKDKYPRANYV